MKLQDQVCTLEQAKRLKELGIRQDISLAIHVNHKVIGDTVIFRVGELSGEQWPAFTVAEIKLMLPCRIWIKGDMYNLIMQKVDNSWHEDKSIYSTEFWYQYEFLNKENKIKLLGDQIFFTAKTEAESTTDLLIYILENNFSTPEEVNQRLTNG